MDISDWIARWGSWTPAKTALRFEGRRVSYGELDHEIGAMARYLHAHNVSPGDRVGYLGPSCPELLALLFGCARLGAIFVPLNVRMPSAELHAFVEAIRPQLLVAEQDLLEVALDSAGRLAPNRVKAFQIGRPLVRFAPAAERVPAGSGVDAAAPALILFTSGPPHSPGERPSHTGTSRSTR